MPEGEILLATEKRRVFCDKGVNVRMRSGIWIRMLCLLLCLAVLLPVVTAAAETTKVATYMLRLREKPSSTAKVLDAYPKGTVVTILKKGSDWTKVKVHGKIGYMQSDKLAYAKYKTDRGETIDKSTSKNTTSANATGGSTMYVMKGVRLNLRADKTSNADVIATYRGGTKVTVLRKGKYWSYVEVKGNTGYMANEFLSYTKE